jgi:FkbM family methyltransferase
MKRKIANLLNVVLGYFNVELYKAGFDMVGNLKKIKQIGVEFNSLIDIGASDGKWSIYALRIFKTPKIVAVEPLFEREKSLKKLQNRFPNFEYELSAAGDGKISEIELTVTDDLDGSTIAGKIGTKRIVPLKSVDQIVSERNLKPPFFLKFDTHGFELPILEGAKNTLLHTEVIVMEAYNFRITNESLLFHEMISFMEEKGFRIYNIVDPLCRPLDNVFWQLDLFFLKKENEIFKSGKFKK